MKKVIIMGIFSSILLFFGCNSKKSNENLNTKFEQEEGFTEITTGNDTTVLDLKQDSIYFLPVIRNFDENDYLDGIYVNQKLGKNIGAYIGRVKEQPNGRTGIDYVLKIKFTTIWNKWRKSIGYCIA